MYEKAPFSPTKEEPSCHSLKSLWTKGGTSCRERGLPVNEHSSDDFYRLPPLPPLTHPAASAANAAPAAAAAAAADNDGLTLLIADALVRLTINLVRMYLVQLRRDRLISNECLSCPALLLCRYHHLMYASVAPCAPISAVSARNT